MDSLKGYQPSPSFLPCLPRLSRWRRSWLLILLTIPTLPYLGQLQVGWAPSCSQQSFCGLCLLSYFELSHSIPLPSLLLLFLCLDGLSYIYTECICCMAVMQAGFTFLEAGTMRQKNTVNSLTRMFMNGCKCTLYAHRLRSTTRSNATFSHDGLPVSYVLMRGT